MKNKKGRFAVRLSLKSTFIASLILIITIVATAVKGVKTEIKGSYNYSEIVLNKNISKLENSLKTTELIGHSITNAVEIINKLNTPIDTAKYFDFLKGEIENASNILGAGLFYLPYKFDKSEERAGIYVNSSLKTGQMATEWDDNKKMKEDHWDYFDAEWYTSCVNKKEAFWTSPIYEYTYFKDSAYLTAYVEPVYDRNNNLIAVCDIDLSLEWLQKELLDMRQYNGSNIILLDKCGNVICNPIAKKPYERNVKFDSVLLDCGVDWDDCTAITWNTSEKGVENTTLKAKNGYLYCYRGNLSNGWQIIILNSSTDTFYELYELCLIIFIIAVVGLLFLFFVNRAIIFKASRPLMDFATAAGKITNGRFDVQIPMLNTNDEMSDLSVALSFMQTSVTNYIDVLKVTTSEKERLAGELDIGRTIQTHMLKKQFDFPQGSNLYAVSIPSRQVGGDLYDFYIDGDDLYYIIGDVSGKGVSAALLMAISISAFRASVKYIHSMSEIAGIINNVFYGSNQDDMFITLNLGHINVKTGETEICNCGHNPIILISSSGKAEYMNLDRNIACGVLSGYYYKSNHIVLQSGSRLLLYTDGVTEAENSLHDQYGDKRLLEFANTHSIKDIEQDKIVIDELLSSVYEFTSEAEQFDDITMMSISIC